MCENDSGWPSHTSSCTNNGDHTAKSETKSHMNLFIVSADLSKHIIPAPVLSKTPHESQTS